MISKKNPPIAIVTGAGRGIGRATAIELGKHGYYVLLTARNREELTETAKLVGNATVLAGDVTSPKHVQKLVARAKAMGRLGLIVNNAGYAPAFSIEKMPVEEWDKIFATNLSAVFYLCKFAWPLLIKQGGGVIVNISSVASRDPFPGLGAYGAAKAGLNLFGLDLARQGKPHGIRVHTLALGAVETTMLRKLVSIKELPRGQTLQPIEVAEAVYACVAGVLRHTSGEVIYLAR